MLGASGAACGTCGGDGQPCCGSGNNGTCSTGFGCAGRNAASDMPGTCGTCGGVGQPCCTAMGGMGGDGGVSACMSGLRCMMSMCAAIPDGGPPDVPAGQ